MELTNEFVENLCKDIGANNCAMINVSDIVFDAGLRQNCELNYCGQMGKTWVCPPHCGPIDDCIQKAGSYQRALVIQTISPLEDSYDFEGMQEAQVKFHEILCHAAELIKKMGEDYFCLSAGGCNLCEKCAVQTSQPCRFPDKAYPSLESHGIYVTDLAAKSGMNYINGKDTVTYFGAILFN